MGNLRDVFVARYVPVIKNLPQVKITEHVGFWLVKDQMVAKHTFDIRVGGYRWEVVFEIPYSKTPKEAHLYISNYGHWAFSPKMTVSEWHEFYSVLNDLVSMVIASVAATLLKTSAQGKNFVLPNGRQVAVNFTLQGETHIELVGDSGEKQKIPIDLDRITEILAILAL